MLIPVGRSGWAIAAGYLGLFSFVVLPAPISLIVALIAISDIRKNPEKHGMGRAIFGLVMGILGTVALAFGLIGMIVGRRNEGDRFYAAFVSFCSTAGVASTFTS